MRRCTGFKPSRTSGSAREMMTLIAYSRYERFISSEIENGSDVARLFAAGRLVVGVVGHDFLLSADSATHALGRASDGL